MKIRSVEEDVEYWKDRYGKIVWVANQALKKLPQSLHAAEAMIKPFKTPPEISKFVKECRIVYDDMTKSSSRIRMGLAPKLDEWKTPWKPSSREMRGEITQMNEQMAKILELLTRGPPNGQNTA
ncbi:hypothetical protein CR513_14253, partial [Mucuna pruriens]